MTTADPTAGPQIVSGDYDEAAAHHDAMLREIESLRFQLAEAREALVRVAKTLGWDAPPEQVPSGIPDLAIAVQQLRHERDQARGVLAEARQQRDQAAEALVRAETERDEALCAITKIAEVLGFPGGDLREAIRAMRRERDDALQEAESVGRQLHSSTREVDRLIAQLATVTEERDEARAEIDRLERAAHEQGADLWIAEDRLDRLRRQVLAVAEDLERYASDLRPERLPMSERKLAWTLRQIAGDAPETAPESPQTDEQAQVRGDSRTEASAGADGPWSDAWCRTQMQRLCIAASENGLRWRDYDVVGAVIAEIDRLRTALNSQGGSR